MTLEELKLRRLSGHHLLSPTSVKTVTEDLCGLQAQFFPNAVHSLKIRSTDPCNTADLIKNWTIRGTVHLFPLSDLPLYLREECYRSMDWSRPSWWNQRPGWALTPQRQKYLAEVILSALQDRPQTRENLKEICRTEGMTAAEESSMFDPWGGGIRELCERGFLHQLPREEKTFALSPEITPMEEEATQLELARRYFTHYGPATIHDCQYFFRVSAAQVKRWLNVLPVTATEYNGTTYFYIDGEFLSEEIPHCLFLAGFDALMLGYEKKESLFLPQEHLRQIFNLAGIVHPAILVDGEVVGRWRKKDHKLTITCFSPSNTDLLKDHAQNLWGDLKKVDIP